MNKNMHLLYRIGHLKMIFFLCLVLLGCHTDGENHGNEPQKVEGQESPEYFYLRPELEKMYGYTQAVRVGNVVKIGGVISIDDKGNALAKDDYLQQMKNCYSGLDKVLKHYGCTFDDVVLENIYTTSMTGLQKNASYRGQIYKKQFPTGSWIGVKELGLPEIMIEIEMEAIIPVSKSK